ncbi:MAG: hypothetical protein M1822_003284 [Bathelium mastoideum]|nr:MAG: hypothetical protein M1822_003284 [Bathelium mastoideum]
MKMTDRKETNSNALAQYTTGAALSTPTHRDAAQGNEGPALDITSRYASRGRSKFHSKIRRASARGRMPFQRVLSALFRSSGSNSRQSAAPLTEGVAVLSGSSSVPTASQSFMGVDILSPSAFTFSGPELQHSSTSHTLSTTSRVSAPHRQRASADHMRWSFMTGGSSFLRSPDGSNDESALDNTPSDLAFESFHGPSSQNSPGIISSSQRLFSDSQWAQSLEQFANSRSDLRAFLVQQAAARELSIDKSDAYCVASDVPSAHPSYEIAASETPPISDFDVPCPAKASWLPLELLHQVFGYLHPTDFNSARHVCRRWLLASFDCRMLCEMLRRAGWSTFVTGASVEENDHDFGNTGLELRLSGALARVCALGPDWTGCGLPFTSEGRPEPEEAWLRNSALVETCSIDFTELSSGSQENIRNKASGLLFTVSACGRFLIVADGDLVYIYQLGPGHDLELTVRVACPRRVLGVSMDTTCGRYAVAAFLEGRLGMVCDLELWSPMVSDETQDNISRHGTHCPLLHEGDSSDESIDSNQSRSESPLALISAEDSSVRKGTISVAANEIPLTGKQEMRQDGKVRSQEEDIHSMDSKDAGRFSKRSPCPTLIPSKQTIYHDLCYLDDPPRTVAICPSRNCAAFGCNAGIQLHWIDVVTKRQEDRFFPLSATTDVLYFLPPRTGIDTLPAITPNITHLQLGSEARRLRLIGSAIAPHPGAVPARPELSRRMFGARDVEWRDQPIYRMYGPPPFRDEVADIANIASIARDRKESSHERLLQDWSLAELEDSIKQKAHGEASPFRQHRQSDDDGSLANL